MQQLDDIPCLTWDSPDEELQQPQQQKRGFNIDSAELCSSCLCRHCEERFEATRQNLEKITSDVVQLRYQLKIQPGADARFCSEGCWLKFVYDYFSSTKWYASALHQRAEMLLQRTIPLVPEDMCALEEDGYELVRDNMKRTKQAVSF